LFEFAPDPYLVTDLHGTIGEANQAAISLLGTTRSQLKGKPISIFVPPHRRREVRSTIARAAQGRRISDWSLQVQAPQRQVLDVSATVAAMRTGDGKMEMRWILR